MANYTHLRKLRIWRLPGTLRVAAILLGFALLPVAASLASARPPVPPSSAQKKDYLSELEANQIRDAETVSERVRLFLSYAADRLRKIDFELERAKKDQQWTERMASLINGYSGCVDDAADVLEGGLQKQENLRPGLKEMERRLKEFLSKLEQLKQNPQLAPMKEELADATDATRDADETAKRVAKELSAAPERKKP
jgi:hypothetical protein